MKVTKKKQFSPVTILLETEEELKDLTGILAQVSNSPRTMPLYAELQDILGVPMAGLYHGSLIRVD